MKGKRRTTLAVLAAWAVAMLTLGGAASAQDQNPQDQNPQDQDPLSSLADGSSASAAALEGSGGSSPFKVVAKGLNNPRGLALGANGALYVAEAGKGGVGPCGAGAEGGQVCYGKSGALT